MPGRPYIEPQPTVIKEEAVSAEPEEVVTETQTVEVSDREKIMEEAELAQL